MSIFANADVQKRDVSRLLEKDEKFLILQDFVAGEGKQRQKTLSPSSSDAKLQGLEVSQK